MPLELHDLDERTRILMRIELRRDTTTQSLHLPSRLNGAGREAFALLLEATFESGDDATLAAALRGGNLLEETEWSRTRDGRPYRKRVPYNAAETLAEDQFNRFYVRALCVRAIEDGERAVQVYRAKAVAEPRRESQGKLSFLVEPERLLEDLRTHKGEPPELGVPAGPNSGVSVRLVRGPASPFNQQAKESVA